MDRPGRQEWYDPIRCDGEVVGHAAGGLAAEDFQSGADVVPAGQARRTLPTRQIGLNHNPSSAQSGIYVVADILDHSHNLVAGTHRQADKWVSPMGGMNVGSADSDNGAAHQYLTWRCGGAHDLFQDDIVHGADDNTTDSAHRVLRFLSHTAV
jgi:hypothetical protein